MHSSSGSVLAIGSYNRDLVFEVDRVPAAGATVPGKFRQTPGGKGYNQAVASARAAGAPTSFLACVGAGDGSAEELGYLLKEDSIIPEIRTRSGAVTGAAGIFVEDSGENRIVVAPGANALLTPSDAEEAVKRRQPSHLLGVLEVPQETIVAAFRAAAPDAMQVLNLSPVPPGIDPDLIALTNILIINRLELATLVGVRNPEDLSKPKTIHEACRHVGPGVGIVSLGDQGGVLSTHNGFYTWAAASVGPAVDTVAAGDTFAGALVGNLSQGNSLQDALEFARKAAAITVTRPGAAASIPRQMEVAAVGLEQLKSR